MNKKQNHKRTINKTLTVSIREMLAAKHATRPLNELRNSLAHQTQTSKQEGEICKR